MKKQLVLGLLCILMLAVSCKAPQGNGNLDVRIDYSVNANALVTDTLAFQNEAGNKFLITEIQWFLSHMEFQDSQGSWHATDDIYYIDTNIPESQTLHLSNLPVGNYQKMRFTFGLDQTDNQTGRFNNPPERDMFWPDPLGGGYHYMKLNGKYLDNDDRLVPLNIHLGIGQNEDRTEFYQNFFNVEIPADFTITEGAEQQLILTMVIDNWFRNPHTYDFQTYGSAIMENQEAQAALKENGTDVFTTKTTEDMKSLTDISKEILQKAAPKPHFMTWENLSSTFSNFKIKK